MELWIRSQDRETLIKAKNLTIDKDGKVLGNIISDDNKCICDYWILGMYDSYERALEVLDEIQNFIQPKMNFIVSQHIDFDNDREGLIGCNILKEEPKIEKISDVIVYEMPKE